MEQENQNLGVWGKVAAFVVDKRSFILFFYAIALVFSVFAQGWVSVCNDLTAYLPETTETRRGLTIMEDELVTYGSARVVVSQITRPIAEHLADRLAEIDGVAMVTFDDTEDHFKGSDAEFDLTFSGESTDPVSEQAMEEVKAVLAPYDTYISSEVGYSQSETLNQEMTTILGIAAIIIVAVLLLTSRSYAEVIVLVLTFGAAAILNKGTNFIFGEISFVSDSVTVVLQLALAIDYAIILLHRFTEERETHSDRDACVIALAAAIPSISSSSMTTISGLFAMMFMQFRIGFDLGMVLIKAICLSMLSVFTLMPCLLMLFAGIMDRTRHKEFLPSIDGWGKIVCKLRFVGVPVFCVVVAAAMVVSQNCPYVYGYSTLETDKKNDHQIAVERVNDTFGSQNITALLVPAGDYAKEKKLLAELERFDEVDHAMGLANIEAMDGWALADSLTPRQFAEMTDLDLEMVKLLYAAYAVDDKDYGKVIGGLDNYGVPLMDMFLFVYEQKESGMISLEGELNDQLDDLHEQLSMAQDQMLGEHYDRIVLCLNLPEEGEETFAFLDTLKQTAAQYYEDGDVWLVGDSTSDRDLCDSFARDNVVISVLSVLFVILVLLFTFQSVGLPILLILVIQGSIWISFTFPALSGDPVFFMSYLIVTSIQMGANIDYAIVISTRYDEMKALYKPTEAIGKALSLAFPTIVTSGTILTAAAFVIGKITSEPSIVGIGQCLARGTLISIVLVMFFLPQILVMGDTIVEKTRFSVKTPQRSHRTTGAALIHGRVRGQVNGLVDGTFHGTIYGETNILVASGSVKGLRRGAAGPQETDEPDYDAPLEDEEMQQEKKDET